jgi:sensor histidine kinase YesM
MNFQNFFFSEKRSDRIKQHLLFWGLWYPYITLTHAAFPFGFPEMAYFRNPVYTFTESFFIVLAQVPTAYGMLYFILPKFILKKKYVLTVVWIIISWIAAGSINLIFLGKVVPQLLALFIPAQFLPQLPRTEGVSFFMAVIATNKGAFTITASALMLKFAKHWYHKEHRNLQLQKENTQSQLRLLTAQIHPHFLFNTLNNIYSQIQQESVKGSKMVMGLSDMLRYILYEGQKPMVPLKNELDMIREYIHLEKIRYGNKLDVHILTPIDTDHHLIAPLLLLPFVENCFKHGTSHMLQNPWINLTLELKDDTLIMKLMNGRAPTTVTSSGRMAWGSIMCANDLTCSITTNMNYRSSENDEVFVVDLTVELARREEVGISGREVRGHSKITHA